MAASVSGLWLTASQSKADTNGEAERPSEGMPWVLAGLTVHSRDRLSLQSRVS